MIEEFLKSERKFINKELISYFDNLYATETEIFFADFYKQLKEFIMPKKVIAKRIHPILLIAAFSGIGNPMYLEDQIDEVRKVSIAVELLHSGHLIHDDVIDDDDSRRGNPSFHIRLRNELSQLYKSMNLSDKNELLELYGRNMGLLGGTFGYILGLNVIKSAKFSENSKLLAINEYTEALDSMMKGQIIEEYMEYNNITMSLEQYLNIAEMLRARLLEKSTKIGAILARGNIHYQIKPLSEAMLLIGQAYSIRDDILDVINDIKGKKKKFVYILAVQNTDEEQSRILNIIYQKPELTKDDVEEVKTIFDETNALVVAEQFSKSLVEEAKRFLKDIYPDLNKEQKVFFNEFSEFIYLRDF